MFNFLKDMFDSNKKEFKKFQKTVEQINHIYQSLKKLSDEQLQEKTNEFKERLKKGETLEDLLPEAFAVVKETSTRVLGLTHYDVQLLGGIVLHYGNIAEMKTGEGKTLVATLPAYLNALEGKGVHIATANDYLAERDRNWVGKIFEFLGLTVGVVKTTSTFEEREAAYQCDIVYGTAVEFGFDYLRSNLAKNKNDVLQKNLHYIIVDEADSILIDEAKTPMTIAGEAPQNPKHYHVAFQIANSLNPDEDYQLDIQDEKVMLTDEGITKVETLLRVPNLYDPKHVGMLIKIQNALTAKHFILKDKHYIVDDNKIVLIDQMTGRLVPGRKLSAGIQQAVEVKENLEPSPELAVKALITYQNFFRLYSKISGMTGTAKTEENELFRVYGLNVYEIPTHKPVIRQDLPDVCLKTKDLKFKYIVDEVVKRNQNQQPILIGTDSIESSMLLSSMLTEKGLEHNVLHATNHEKEAEIIANAGKKGAITIVCNMAGRGTDIQLEDGVAELGGLHVIGTTRHENRRIDNQLRGRAGRQGDPGSSQYFVSLEDEIIQKFGGNLVKQVLDKIKVPDDMPIEHPFITKLLQQVQISCEDSNAKVREFLLSMDDILHNQRNVIYENRSNILHCNAEELKTSLFNIYKEVAKHEVEIFCNADLPEEWNLDAFLAKVNGYMFPEDAFDKKVFQDIINEGVDTNEIREAFIDTVYEKFNSIYNRKESHVGLEVLANVIRPILLDIVDQNWMEFLSYLNYLQTNLRFKAMGGGNVLLNYSIESFEMFEELKKEIQSMMTINTLCLELRLV